MRAASSGSLLKAAFAWLRGTTSLRKHQQQGRSWASAESIMLNQKEAIGRHAGAAAILPIRGDRLVVERSGRRILDGIDIEIDGHSTLALMGPNGAGKSLLARVLAGLVRPTAGRVSWGGVAPERARAPKIGFVFQRPVLLRRSALANV